MNKLFNINRPLCSQKTALIILAVGFFLHAVVLTVFDLVVV